MTRTMMVMMMMMVVVMMTAGVGALRGGHQVNRDSAG